MVDTHTQPFPLEKILKMTPEQFVRIFDIGFRDEGFGPDNLKYDIKGVHFVGFVNNTENPISRFAENVPEGTEYVINFDDNIGGLTYDKGNYNCKGLYSAHGLALIPKKRERRLGLD